MPAALFLGVDGGGLLVRGQRVAQEALQAAAGLGWWLEPVARVEEPGLGALRLARGEIPLPDNELCR
jgi:myo-inositol catabolism protein IolC